MTQFAKATPAGVTAAIRRVSQRSIRARRPQLAALWLCVVKAKSELMATQRTLRELFPLLREKCDPCQRPEKSDRLRRSARPNRVVHNSRQPGESQESLACLGSTARVDPQARSRSWPAGTHIPKFEIDHFWRRR